jgi:uncharacterized protein (TIGR02452 family)
MSWFTSFVSDDDLKQPAWKYRDIAQENIRLFDSRTYTSPSGAAVDLGPAIEHCLQAQKTFNPTTTYEVPPTPGAHPISIELTHETTTAACHRLVVDLHLRTVALNFANCLGVGGGFLHGQRAQEEAICRCSVLYSLLCEQTEMYAESRKDKNKFLFRDYLVYSPDVPIIRDDQYDFLDDWFPVSFISAAAPDLRWRDEGPEVHAALDSRIRKVVQCAAQQGAQALVLGAFGCGAFCNDPTDVAGIFKQVLVDEQLATHFEKVVFAIYGTTDNFDTFKQVFEPEE